MEEFELNVYEDIIAADYVNTTSFKEFCDDIDKLDSLFIDYSLYAEAIEPPKVGFKKAAGGIIKNTSDTISNTVGLYGTTTSVGGSAVKALWDLTFNAINLITKILLWFLDKITNIPILISKLIKNIGKIPSSVKVKISGDIKLYITANDINTIYNDYMINKIDDFINLMKIFREGDTWSTFFRRRVSVKTDSNDKVSVKETLKNPTDNDMKIGRKMSSIYKYLRGIEFSETVISMKDKENIDTYFGSKKVIKFTDMKGQSFEMTYHEALWKLTRDLKNRSSDIELIRNDIGDKFSNIEGQQKFARMSQLQQRRITETIQMVSKIVTVIGNLTKYVLKDIHTIDTATKKLMKNGKLKNENSENTNTKDKKDKSDNGGKK